MGFIRDFFHRKKKETQNELEEQQPDGIGREDFDLTDSYQRGKYIQSCLEQIAEATREIENLNGEYKQVNAYLQDMELIEYMPEQEKKKLFEHANAIIKYGTEHRRYEVKPNRLSDSNYHKMERLEEDADEGIIKIHDAEIYHNVIKQDLQKLEGEKQACLFRRQEAEGAIANMRGISVICAFAIVACIFVLLVLQLAFAMETLVGYLLTGVVGAITLTYVFVKYLEAIADFKTASSSVNRIILLQNKVKIRYVNNTNLLDYLYMKFDVKNGEELSKLWKQYQEEKEERQKMEQVEAELDFYSEQLVKLLRRHKITDPIIWLHQPEAIVDPKELVEVRHNLIVRRQKLRKQIEYNTNNAKLGQDEMKEMVSDYPQYANEILKKVSDYESRYQ